MAFFFSNSTQIWSLLHLSFCDAGAAINFSCFTVILLVIHSFFLSTEIILSKIPNLTKNKGQNSPVSSTWIFIFSLII